MAGILACGCGSSAGPYRMSGPPSAARGVSAASPVTITTEAESAAAGRATDTFRADIDGASADFVSDVDRLQVAVDHGAVPVAKADELAAQAEYDRFRQLESGNQTGAATLDELATDVGTGQSFGGLHAVERDLWSGGDAAADITGLVAQAPVAEYLLAKDVLAPEAIGTTGVDELGWVNDMAVPGLEEQYSHRDAVDIAASVGAAHDAFGSIEPLGQLVAPSFTHAVAQSFIPLLHTVTSLGDPTDLPDAAIPDAVRLALSQQIDATAARLAQLAAALAPFGTTGASS